MKLKRDESLDFLRGFGILLMVIGHIGFTTADIYIYAFHMPLFYMISGYLVKPDVRKKFSAHVVSRAKRLLIPYFLFGFAQYIIYLGIHAFNTPDAKELLVNLLLFPTKGLAIAEALWFLFSLFLIEIVFELLLRIKNEGLRFVVVAVVVVAGFFVNEMQYDLVFALETAMVGILFYYAGYLIRRYKLFDCIQKGKTKFVFGGVAMILFMPITWLCYKNGQIAMYYGVYQNEFIFILAALFMTVFWWCVAKQVVKINKLSWFNGYFVFLGKNSMLFLLLNQFFIFFYRKVLLVVIEDNKWLVHAAELLLVLLSLHVFALITNRLKVSKIWRG